MIITQGLFDNMVLQRTSRNVCDARFAGTCTYSGTVTATVMRKKKPVLRFKNVPVGQAAEKSFSGRLSGVPVGGPYEIVLSIIQRSGAIAEKLTLKNVLIGDVWILAGQSNMEGVGYTRDALPPHPQARVFKMDDRWEIARDRLHELWKAVDQVHVDLVGGSCIPGDSHIGVGPGLSFAREMYSKTKIPQGMIACAHGGTSMAQWDPALKHLGGKSLYGAMIRRFEKNGGAVAGVLWYQGCSETDAAASKAYTERMQTLISSMRRDFGRPDLPVAAVQISHVGVSQNVGNWWSRIRELQRLLPESIPNLSVVPSIDLELDDFIHLSGSSQNRLGVRLAYAMLQLTKQKKGLKAPPALHSIAVERDRYNLMANVIIRYDNVDDGLKSAGRPTGFALTQKRGEITNDYIYRIDLDKNKVILKTCITPLEAEGMHLYYGFGADPYCNITDGADRSLPAMGPVRVGTAKAYTDFVRKIRITELLPLSTGISAVEFPRSLDMKERNFGNDNFLNLHNEIGATSPQELVVYYATSISCTEAMKLNVHLGYDGPIKAWWEGKEHFRDPQGTNPAIPSKGIFAVEASPGRHNILIALATNGGKAWGIFLRFERTDVTEEMIDKGPEFYQMPEIE